MKSIKHKLIVSTFLSIAACILLAVIFSWKYTENVVHREFVENTEAEVAKIDDGIALFFDEMKKDLNMVAENPTVKSADGTISSYIEVAPETPEESPEAEGPKVEAQIYSVYDNFAKDRDNISDVFMGTETGGYIQYAEGEVAEGYDPRERPWYTQAMESPGEVVRTNAYYWEAADAVNVSLAKTIENSGGTVVGVQAMDISLDSLTKMAEEIKIGDEGYIVIAEEDGTILSNPKNPETNFTALSELGIDGIENEEFDFESGGEEFIGMRYSSEKTGWNFISIVPRSELNSKVAAFTTVVVILGVISVLAALISITIVSSKIVKPIRTMTAFIGRVEDGDFSSKIDVKGQDEVARLGNSINNMIENVRHLIDDTKTASEDVSKSAESIGFMSEQLDNTADEMVNAVSQVATDLSDQGRQTEHIVDSIEGFTSEIEAMSLDMTEKTKAISEMTEKGLSIVENLDKTTEETKASSKALAETTEILSEKSKNIGEIVGLIDKVTEQTSLLSLNASIEAARAGEAGKGFAVVASEISKLAEESKSSTSQIEKIISEIQVEIENSVSSMECSNALVEDSAEIVGETKTIFGEMVDIMTDMEAEVSRINRVVGDMKSEKEEIADSLGRSAIAAEQTAALSEEITASTEEQTASIHTMAEYIEKLEGLSKDLIESINRFRV